MQAAHQGPAVLGLAMVGMGEELGGTMSLRMLEHLLRYGDAPVRHALRLLLPAPLPACFAAQPLRAPKRGLCCTITQAGLSCRGRMPKADIRLR